MTAPPSATTISLRASSSLIFLAARKAHDQLKDTFRGGRDYLVYQLIRLVEEFIASDRLVIPGLFHQEPLRKKILLTLNVDRIVEHLLRHVYEQNAEKLELIDQFEGAFGQVEGLVAGLPDGETADD